MLSSFRLRTLFLTLFAAIFLSSCDVAIQSEFSIRDINDVLTNGKSIPVSADFQIEMASSKTCSEQSEKIVQLLSKFIKVDGKECKKDGMNNYLLAHTYLALLTADEYKTNDKSRPPLGFIINNVKYPSQKSSTEVTLTNLIMYIDKDTFETISSTLKGADPISQDFEIKKISFGIVNDTITNKQFVIATDAYINTEPQINRMIIELDARKKTIIQLNKIFIDFVVANKVGRVMSIGDDIKSYFD